MWPWCRGPHDRHWTTGSRSRKLATAACGLRVLRVLCVLRELCMLWWLVVRLLLCCVPSPDHQGRLTD